NANLFHHIPSFLSHPLRGLVRVFGTTYLTANSEEVSI
ncbi:MAG: hypothetical protein ACI87H_003482, partial [Gammaproteobacteria bacterium]